MATVDIHTRSEISIPAPSFGIGSFFRPIVKRMQYARMIGVMNELSDRELRDIGLNRGEIKAFSHKAVYGEA